MSFTYEYARPAVTVECVVVGLDDGELKVLLIKRNLPPFEHKWALPGGFVQMEESLEDAARRELSEEAGIDRLYLEQLYSFGDVERDPRGRVITVAYYALVNLADHDPKAATDAEDVGWFELSDMPELAFDHQRIVEMARERLRGKVRYAPIGFELLPPRFTLTNLQKLYETILDRELDKRNFRKKILGMDLLVDTGQIEKDVAHRAARLYRFDKAKYRKLAKRGFSFSI